MTAEDNCRAFDELIAETEADPVRGPILRDARERLKREGIGPITIVDLDWLPADGAAGGGAAVDQAMDGK